MRGPCILLASRRQGLGGGCHRSPIGPFNNFLRTNIYDALLEYCSEEGVKETPGDADYSGKCYKEGLSPKPPGRALVTAVAKGNMCSAFWKVDAVPIDR